MTQSPIPCEAKVGATEVTYIPHGIALNLYLKKHSDFSTSSPLYTHTCMHARARARSEWSNWTPVRNTFGEGGAACNPVF